MLVHTEEKIKLYELLDGRDCRITLTPDIWTSEHANISYTCLTAHYVDDNWELKKKILAYRHIPYPHDGETLSRFINDLILEWNLDKKLFSMVVDNTSSNDSMLRKWENSQHDFLKVMVGPMKQKFEKCWEESCLVLGIAIVLDPRFKMNLVEFYYDAIYDSDANRYVERVKISFQDLCIEYGGQVNYVSNHPYPTFGEGISEDDYSAFDE
ncbi:hypothetical protein M9H77_07124 [Catharanthus roseus]|uniref:Uncharacterized protein n=1 Tax=Catharanthus roseus TaxID=4058 RepID=A0ACC0BU17_CATRO|nr:hypothetical protein M9H77_07124 [Catharanthus roseus]